MATEGETKEPISESPSGGAAAAIDKSSISNETAKDEALCTVAVGTIDSSKGEFLVEAPKETVSKQGETVSEELKNEGDLTNNGNNTEAKGEKVITAKQLAESESSDVNVMVIDKERATDESASQNRLQQKDQDQDDNIVHAQVTKFDMVESSEVQAEDKEDEGTTDIEKLEVNGDNIKKEAENGMLSDESTDGIYNTPAAEPFEKNNSMEPLEIMNEDLEPADKFESRTGAVLEVPDVEKFERVNEGEHVKLEAETGLCNDERTNVIYCIPVAEPSEEGSTQEPLEKTSKEELEPAVGEQEHDKPESFQEPEEEKLKRVNEDDIKIEAETEICADKRIDDADSMSVAEPPDKEIEQEPPEITAKDGPEPEKEEPEHGKLESSIDSIPDEQEERELQKVNEYMNVNAEAENGTRDDERTKEFEPEHEKLEKYLDAVKREAEEELERVIEDKKIKMEVETEICADERITDADSTSVAEPSENENRQEPIEIIAKDAYEPAEDVREHSEREGTLDAVLEKPEASILPDNGPESCGLNRNHENEDTSKQDLVMNVEECSVEDDKEYEPIEKETLNLLPEYESTSVGAAASTDNSSISHETAKDEDLCTVAVGTLDSSEGEIIIDAPKETDLKYVEIVSEELKNERDLISNVDNTEAKDEKVIAAKELAESESSDVNVMAIDKGRATDECASQDSLHQKDQDDNIVHAQAKKFDVVEASEAQAEDKEDEGTTDSEKLEVNGDNIKKEAENEMLSDESNNGIDNTPAAEPLEIKNSKEPHEIMNKDVEPADKLERPIDAVPEEPDVEKLERVNEDKHVKVEAETGIFDEERTNGIDCISVEEPSEKGNTQESLEKPSKEELEAAKYEPEHDKLKSFPEPEEEKLGRVNEDNVKIEGEPEICADERIDDADSMSVTEPPDEEIKQEPLEITAKEDNEPAKDEPEHGKLESSLDPVAHELEEKELERINEDTNVKVETENEICDDERTTGIDSISEAEPSDKENRHEPLEMTTKENLEPEKDEPEHEKLEKSLDAVTEEPEEKLERVIEDKKIKMEAETEICDDERTADADSTPVLEHSENENRQEAIEITAKEDLEPAEDVPEHSEPESSLDAVLQEPEASMQADNGPESSRLNRNHGNETTSKEDLVMTLEECSVEDEKKYEPVEKEAVNFPPEYKERDDDNRNDGGEELEDASNLICENQAHETVDSEGNIEVSNSNEKASEEFELVLELVPELKSQETRTETEGSPIEKSNFDENSSDKNTMVDGSGNDTEATNGEKESSSENDIVKGTTYGGSEIHEDVRVGMGFCKEQKVTEKLDSSNELEQGKKLSVAVEENAADKTLGSAVQKEKWEKKLEGPSKVVSGKTIVAEESTFTQEGEKEDPSEKHEESFIEKGEVVILGQVASRMDTEDQNSKPDGENSENIHVGIYKPEEIPNSACEEQPRQTINGSIGVEVDGEKRELSQKLELVSNSIAEDKNQEIIKQKDFDVSTNDCTLQNMVSEMVKKNDDKENTTKEANLNKAFDDCRDSHVSIVETINNEVGQKKEEGSSTANEDQNYQATDTSHTTDKLEVHVSEEKETQYNIFKVSLPEEKCQKETGESNAIKIDNSTNDEDPKTMMPGAAGLNKDAETAKEKGEEDLNTAKEDGSDDHTSIASILPDQIGEHEESSKTEYGEQIYLVINDECSIEADIHKEKADPDEFEKITQPISKDHKQGDVNEPKSTDNSDNTDHLDKAIPEITAHSDDPETAKVKDEDVLEKDYGYKCDDPELVPRAADCEVNKEAPVQERKENLDSSMELGPEDLRQDVICETKSAKVEKELDIDENEKSSAVRTEYITDATSGAKLEETSARVSYELESDDKQDNTNIFVIREEEMPDKEETAGHILEKTLSTVNANTTEDISENQIEGKEGAKNANSEIIGCEKNQATEEEIPEVTNRDQNKESYDGDDRTKNGTTTEEVKVSDTADVAKNLTETVEVQISEDASQVMKVDAYECQDYEENGESKENTNTSQMLQKSIRNPNAETNEIHDDLTVISTGSDEATYGNLHKNEGEKATKEGYGTGDGIPNQETLNVKELVDDIAKEEAHNEGKHCRDVNVSVAHNLVEESTDMEGEEPRLQKESMELETHGKTEQNERIVAQNEEIAEKSETLQLHKDTKELIEQSSNILLGSQEIATPIENIEKNIIPDEDAAEADLEQIPDDETDAKENSEQVTDTVPNDEVKEDDHQTSKELVMDSTENLITSANTAFQTEKTKQEVGEQFSKISDYWPRGYNEEASMDNTVDAEHPKETMSVVEQPEAGQITHTSTDSTAACETEEQGEEVYLPEDSGLDTIYKEGREELKEVSDSMPKKVDKKIGSSVELTEDRESPHEESVVQEPQVDQPDIVTETEELTDKAGHEVEVANLQEKKQQTGLGDLPVSQFLLKYILQEEGDTLNEARDGENEDVSNKQNDGDKQHEGKIPKQEDKSAPLSVVQLIEETSTPEDKVGSKKLEDSSESVQAEEGYEGKENSDITVFKDGPGVQSTPDESTSSLVVTEDGKDEVDTLSSEMSNNIARDESMEVNSTEQNSQGSTVDNEHCKPDLVQDEKIEGTVLEETLTRKEIQKDNETLDNEVDVSTFGKTSEEDNLQKEGGEESKECLQDVVKAEGSNEVSDGQSTMDDSEYGEILEIKSEIEKVECGEVGNQVQILKNDSTEELTLSEPQIIQQTDLVNETKIHALETVEKFVEDKNSTNSLLDRKQMVEAKVDENKADEEKHEKEEKEEFKPEKFSSNAAIVETKESELKPMQKCEQTRKSSESSTTEDHGHEETLQLHSEVKIVESGEKKQDAVNQNQVQMNNGLNEEEKLSDSATQPLHMAEKLEEQSSVANVDENHAVQTTETKVDGNKAGDEKEEEEEEEDEHDPEESGQNSRINVEARDAELKPAPKKSHGLLSGVGSKVKHSIAKVKKAITGKSSHSKTVSAK